ncbi:MAG: phosphotransferase [Bryobacteraceae bacterium]
MPELYCPNGLLAERMRKVAQERLFEDVTVFACRILQQRFKPGKSGLVSYTFQTSGGDRIAAVRFYAPGGSAPALAKANAQGQPVIHLAEFEAVAWIFPGDRKLRSLPMLADRSWITQRGRALGLVPADRRLDYALVHYVAEHTCTASLTDATTGDRWFIKTYYDGQAEATDAWMRRLHRQGLGAAEPVLDREANMLWQHGLPGRAIDAGDRGEVAAAARALAALHRCSMPELPHNAIAGRIAHARTLIDGHDRLFALLENFPWDASGRPASPLHGDPHPQNFLFHHGAASLIDLDNLRIGDPLEDLGSLLGGLFHHGAPDSSAEAFVDAYRAAVDWEVPEQALRMHTAAALVTERACRCLSRRKADAGHLESILDRAYELAFEPPPAESLRRYFETMLDTGRAARVLGLDHCSVADVHYKTYLKPRSWHKSRAAVLYRLSAEPRFIHVELSADGDRVTRRFPDDPALPWLAEIAASPDVEILNYRPGIRCTARHRMAGRAVYSKTYADDRGEHIGQRIEAISNLLAHTSFRTARPCGYSRAIRTLWLEEVPGRPLIDELRSPELLPLLRESGRQLALVHHCGASAPPRATPEEQLADIRKKLQRVVQAAPGAAGDAHRIVEWLEEALPSSSPAPALLVHGDFHLRQLTALGERVALFDFDESSIGDATEDFAHFHADLHLYGLPEERVDALMAELLQAYESAAGRRVPPDRLAWHTAVQHATRAYRACLQLRPDLATRTKQCLHRAVQAIDSQESFA